VSAADTNMLAVPAYPCSDSDQVSISAISSAGGASISFRLVQFSAPSNIAGVSPAASFTSVATADAGAEFSGTPNAWVDGPIAGIWFGIKVDSITAGSVWTITATCLRNRRRDG
jgi:hypothetical protein